MEHFDPIPSINWIGRLKFCTGADMRVVLKGRWPIVGGIIQGHKYQRFDPSFILLDPKRVFINSGARPESPFSSYSHQCPGDFIYLVTNNDTKANYFYRQDGTHHYQTHANLVSVDYMLSNGADTSEVWPKIYKDVTRLTEEMLGFTEEVKRGLADNPLFNSF